MPDVGLFTATKPLDDDMKVVIKYSVEVNGLPVYEESYSIETLREELKKDEESFTQLWARRVKCVVCCRKRRGFSACVTRCMTDGKCCDEGREKEKPVDDVGPVRQFEKS